MDRLTCPARPVKTEPVKPFISVLKLEVVSPASLVHVPVFGENWYFETVESKRRSPILSARTNEAAHEPIGDAAIRHFLHRKCLNCSRRNSPLQRLTSPTISEVEHLADKEQGACKEMATAPLCFCGSYHRLPSACPEKLRGNAARCLSDEPTRIYFLLLLGLWIAL